MTTSDNKRLASRQNAAKSTGPKTSGGKARASQNATRHGILSQGLLLADEDAGAYDALFQSLVDDLRMSLDRYVVQQTGLPEERMREALTKLIEQKKKSFAEEYGLLENRLKVAMLRERHQAMKIIPPEAELFARYQVALDNTLTKAIKALREAQVFRLSVVEQSTGRDE